MPLRPITLIYGSNSAGKSSVLHALALAHHAIETGDFDTQRTRIGGEAIDLGGFRHYVHRREQNRHVELGFELNPTRIPKLRVPLPRADGKTVLKLVIGEGVTTDQRTLFGDSVRKPKSQKSIHLEKFAVEVDDFPVVSMNAIARGLLQLDRLDHSNPIVQKLFQPILMVASNTRETSQEIRNEDFDALRDMLDELVPRITAKCPGLIPRIEKEIIADEAEEEGDDRIVRILVPIILHDLVERLGSAIEKEIRRLRYLGPLRSYPPRNLAFSQHHDPNWSAGGGYAWDVVRRNESVRRRVNSWLGDSERLQTPYELVVRDLLPSSLVKAELPSRLEDTFRNLLVSIFRNLTEAEASKISALARRYAEYHDEGRFPRLEEFEALVTDAGKFSHGWVQEFVESRRESLQDVHLIDKRTGTAVSHRDVGIGVSQVLPVLVTAYASEKNLLAIEQPEIHLHPALQAELGDVFVESALGNGGNTFLVETHSEHLLLRIMRRMRETSTGELPDGVPEVRPTDVMVLFVEPYGPQSIVREMPLNERGELVKSWPGGFFEEGLREIF